MDVFYSSQGVSFEWNVNKAQSNVQKHGVTFEEAAEAFFDPFYQIGDASVGAEQREFIIGYTFSQQLLLVCICRAGEPDTHDFSTTGNRRGKEVV